MELFRSTLEDLAHTPGEGVESEAAQTSEPAADESPTGELRTDGPRGDESSTAQLRADELRADELRADELRADELRTDEPPADESPTGELPAVPAVPAVPADEARDDELPADAPPADESSTGGLPAVRADEVPDDEPPLRDVAPPPPSPGPPPPAAPLASSDSGDVDTSLPPSVARPGFGRAPAQRLAEALAQGEGPGRQDDDEPSPGTAPADGPGRRDDDEPLRGTVAPVLRRSTERVRHPTSTIPVIRPPVMPTPPSEDAPVPARQRTVPWQQALAGDVLPHGKKRRRGGRSSKPRHESGGVGEYRPKVVADRSLTLLVIAMLLVLAALVATAVWAFWPRVSGAIGSSPPLGVPRAAGGP